MKNIQGDLTISIYYSLSGYGIFKKKHMKLGRNSGTGFTVVVGG